MTTVRKRNQTAWLAAAFVFIIPLMVWSFSSNPPLGGTGAPGESTCASCHGGPGSGNVTITSPTGTTYTPGVTKPLVVTVTDSSASGWGYEMTAVQATATSTGAGTFTAADANSGVGSSGSKSYAFQVKDLAGTTAVLRFRSIGIHQRPVLETLASTSPARPGFRDIRTRAVSP